MCVAEHECAAHACACRGQRLTLGTFLVLLRQNLSFEPRTHQLATDLAYFRSPVSASGAGEAATCLLGIATVSGDQNSGPRACVSNSPACLCILQTLPYSCLHGKHLKGEGKGRDMDLSSVWGKAKWPHNKTVLCSCTEGDGVRWVCTVRNHPRNQKVTFSIRSAASTWKTPSCCKIILNKSVFLPH